jgi:hypothetical protein
VTNRVGPKSLSMVTTIRNSSPVPDSRMQRAACVALASAIALLVSTTASAALREYRVYFEPSPSSSAAGYTLHIGPNAGNYALDFDLGTPPEQGGTVIYAVDLEDSIDLFVALRAYDSNGIQSILSNEFRVAAVVLPPTEPPATPPTTPPVIEEPPAPQQPPVPEVPPVTEPPTEPSTSVPPPVTGLLESGTWLGLSTTTDGMINTVLGDGNLEFLTLDSLAAKGNLRPVRCDLDGDGDRDLVIGFGGNSAGQVAVIVLENGAVASVATITAGTSRYRSRSGSTSPACGDLDDDGRAEIVVGFGSRMRGVVQAFDDMQTGFSPMASARMDAEGYMQIPVPEKFWGPVYPAIGNIDDDDMGELVAGLGRTRKGGRLVVLDDLSTGFEIHSGNQTGEPWLRVDPNPEKLQRRTSVMPALGDIDGDGRDEIAVSFGRGSRARVAMLNDAVDGFPVTSSSAILMTTGRTRYQRKDGETRVAFSDADGDGFDELSVGFRRKGRREVQIFDDMRVGMRPMVTGGGFVSAVDTSIAMIPTPKD